jgi:hypothetical protein
MADVQDAGSSQGDRIDARLGQLALRLEVIEQALLLRPPEVDLSPVLDAVRELRADASAWPAADGPADLQPVLQSLKRIEQVAARPVVDLRPVLDAIADLRGWPADDAPTPDLSPVLSAIARLEAIATEPVDLSEDFDPVTAEVRTLQAGLDDLRERVDALAARPAPTIDEGALGGALREQLGWVAEALADIRRLAGRAADSVPVVDAMRAQLQATDLAPILAAVAELRDATRTADLDGVVAAVTALRQEVRPPDLAPLTEALAAMRAELPGIVDPRPLVHRIEGRIDALEAGLTERDRRLIVDADRLVRIDEVLPRVADALGELPSRLASLTSGVDQAVVRAEAMPALVTSIREAVLAVDQQITLDRQATDALERAVGNIETTLTATRTAFGELRIAVERLTGVVAERPAPAVAPEVTVDLEPVERSIADLSARVGTVAEIHAALERLAATPPGSVDFGPVEKVLRSLADDSDRRTQRTADAVANLERRLELELDDLGRKLEGLAAVMRVAMTTTPPVGAGAGADDARARAAATVSERLNRYRELAAGAADAVRTEVKKRPRKKAN